MADKIKKITTILGVAAGILAILHSSIDLAEKFRLKNHVERTNIELIGQMPVLSKTVVIEPQSKLQMRVSVSFKIFKTGDIIIESGMTRKFLPFALDYKSASADWIEASAYAQEAIQKTLDGTKYKVKTIKYIEVTAKFDENTILEKKTYEDGTIEIKKIDSRSNNILERQSTIINLSDRERAEINRSPYSKEVFQEVSKAR